MNVMLLIIKNSSFKISSPGFVDGLNDTTWHSHIKIKTEKVKNLALLGSKLQKS
jgi:hypothetical protein